MVNVHWMTRGTLIALLNEGKLYRGKNGTVKINNHDELQGQIIRESVWVTESVVGINRNLEAKLCFVIG